MCYIKKEDAIKAMSKAQEGRTWSMSDRDVMEQMEDNIEALHTADVVEVVRCKDCSVPHNKWTGCPNLNGLVPPPDFYCAKGEGK